jgi:hypothetical protein
VAHHLFAEAIERAIFTGKAVDELDPEFGEFAVLSQPQKGALFAFADALRRRGEQRRLARESLGTAVDTDHISPPL